MNSTASIQLQVEYTETIIVTTDVPLKRCTRCHEYKAYEEFNKDRYRSDGFSNKCRLCVKTVFHSKWKNSSYQSDGVTGHWSKWGGGRMDVWREDVGQEWFCQSCGTNQPRDLSPYIYLIQEGDYIRVCAPCLAEDCVRFKQRLLML